MPLFVDHEGGERQMLEEGLLGEVRRVLKHIFFPSFSLSLFSMWQRWFL